MSGLVDGLPRFTREAIIPYSARVAVGLQPGWQAERKFASREDIDTADNTVAVWNYAAGLSYTYSTTADIDTVSSSDASDGQVIGVFGLDSNWDLSTQVVTLNGQNKVTLTTPLIRTYRIKNLGVTDFAGEIYLYVDSAITLGVPDDSTKVRAYVNADDNQTLMSMYTVPRGHSAIVTDFTAALSRGNLTTSAVIEARVRPVDSVFKTLLRTSINSNGTSQYMESPVTPVVLSEKTDLLAQCSVTANDTGVSVIYSFLLAENKYLGIG